MKVWFLSNHGTVVYDFVMCALLRDNVQHHLEAGAPDGKFSCLHALADIVWAEREELLPAVAFRDELSAAWNGLSSLPFGKLAISIHTHAALQRLPQPPAVSGTVLHSATDWPLPIDSRPRETLGELLHTVVFGLLHLAREPLDGAFLCACPCEARAVSLAATFGDTRNVERKG